MSEQKPAESAVLNNARKLMSFSAYQADASRTLTNVQPFESNDVGELKARVAELEKKLQLAVMALGLAGEAGEVIEMVKKYLGHGHQLTKPGLEKELGDVLWYISAVTSLNGIDLNEVAATNIAKLRARYPQGFNHADSLNRVDE